MATPKENPKQAGYQAPAVHKAFQLLRTLAESNRHLGLTELAQELGYSKSTTHGLVHALVKENVLKKEKECRGFLFGPAMADLALSGWNYFKINQQARPIIDSLRDATGETVFLGAELGNRVLIMLTSESGKALKISASPGTTIPLMAGAVGKVFMAHKDLEAVRRQIDEHGLPLYTNRSIKDVTAYLSEIKRVREQGYALDDEEYITGVRAVAVALENQRGPSMAVWVVGMPGNMASANIGSIVGHTFRAAETLRATIEV